MNLLIDTCSHLNLTGEKVNHLRVVSHGVIIGRVSEQNEASIGVCFHDPDEVIPSYADNLGIRRFSKLAKIEGTGRIVLQNEFDIFSGALRDHVSQVVYSDRTDCMD